MLYYLILASLFETTPVLPTFTTQCSWITYNDYYLPYQRLPQGLSNQLSLFKSFAIAEQLHIPIKIHMNIDKYKANLEVQNLCLDWRGKFGVLTIGRQNLKNVGYSEVSNLLLNDWAPAVDGVDFKFNITRYKLHTFIAHLERDQKDPYLWLFSIGRNFGRFYISANRVTILGGKDRPIKLKYLWEIIKGTNPKDKLSPIETDNLFSFTYKYSVGILSFWGEVGAQDWHSESAFYPRWTAFVWGIRADFERYAFITEYATNNREWYLHGQYGYYTHAGEPLGHRMGGNSQSFFFKFLNRLTMPWLSQLSYFFASEKDSEKPNSFKEWKATIYHGKRFFLESILNIKDSLKKQCIFIVGYSR